ncbi:type VI secretion system contractile sheath large subunit [Roseovarius sp.]|uniref:type VI secretion system contractile sheath large subunit n=1 Tax=Roseovarius sp. TaxID=1486281 RepID=UPI003561747F
MAEETEGQGKKQAKKAATGSNLLDEIMEHTRLQPQDEGYDVARQGVESLLRELFEQRQQQPVERVDKRVVDQMIEDLDRRIGEQVDEILHHPEFRELESAWRGLKFLVDRTEFKENIKIQFINASKEDLVDDFREAGEVSKSGLFQHVYTKEYGQFGGEPVGLMVGNYDFGPGGQDIYLLQNMASLGAVSHAPFISGASEDFFGVERFEELPQLKELESVIDGPQYARWRSLRDSDDARNLGLVLPRFMLREPYDPADNPVREFNYAEGRTGDRNDYLWGNAAFAFATRITESFARYRWCPNIVGPIAGGAVKELPIDVVEVDGQDRMVGPVEVQISDRREYELSDLGFVPLTLRKGSDNAAFFSANSVQRPKYFGSDAEARQAELNYRLGTQLPYLFIVNRLAHYVKVLQRENLGSWKSRAELENELNKWLRQYVADQENPSPATRSQRPLRRANLSVEEVEGEAGWYRVSMQVTPHFKFMGANFTLSLTGSLDRAA